MIFLVLQVNRNKQKSKSRNKTKNQHPQSQFVVLTLGGLKVFENSLALLRLESHRDFTGTQIINLKL